MRATRSQIGAMVIVTALSLLLLACATPFWLIVGPVIRQS
jgi:hypothetical protein